MLISSYISQSTPDYFFIRLPKVRVVFSSTFLFLSIHTIEFEFRFFPKLTLLFNGAKTGTKYSNFRKLNMNNKQHPLSLL